MKKAVAEAAAFGLALTGVPFLVREVFTRRKTGILVYRDPDPLAFERHLAYLARRYALIPFDAAVGAMETGDWSAIPPKSLVIHLDGGCAGNRRLLDSLARHGARPTVFLCSGIAASHRAFWSSLDGGRFRRLRLVENRQLLAKLRDEAGFSPDQEHPHRQGLSAEEIGELSAHADFQSHGRFHFSLVSLDDDTLMEELAASRAVVGKLSGGLCEHFSYPYGDHGPREVGAVRVCGYRTARTTLPGWIGPNSDRFRLRIVADVPDDCSVNRLRAHLTGIPRLLSRFTYRVITRHFEPWWQEILLRRPLARRLPGHRPLSPSDVRRVG